VAGYSWKTNQFGLTIDTVTAMELVLPNGKVSLREKDKDLWWALALKIRSPIFGRPGRTISRRCCISTGGLNNYASSIRKGLVLCC
jgi:hypothetical protein